MTKTDIGIYRGLKEKFDPEVHVGFFITTDTGELLVGDQSLGQTISGWEINDGVLKLKLNTGRDILVTFPEASETVKGLLSAADKAQLNALQANLDSKVDKVTGKSLLADSEIEKLAGLPNSTELTNSIATAKAAGDNAQSDLTAHKKNKANPHEVTKEQVGLGNVTNDAQVKRTEMGVAGGVATLDEDGKVPSSQLPSYVDDIVDVYATYSKSGTGVLSNIVLYSDAAKTKLVTGEAGKIYQNVTEGEPNYQFRWTGTVFSLTGASSLIIGEVSGTAYDGAKGKANADNIAKIKGTSLSHIKDSSPVTTAADKVSLNYECFEGDQYGAAGTAHTADIPAATTAKAGVMSAADKTRLDKTALLKGEKLDLSQLSIDKQDLEISQGTESEDILRISSLSKIKSYKQYEITDYPGDTLNEMWDNLKENFVSYAKKLVNIPAPREGLRGCAKFNTGWYWVVSGPIVFDDSCNEMDISICGEIMPTLHVDNVFIFDDVKKPENIYFTNGFGIRGDRFNGKTIGTAIEIRSSARLSFAGTVLINDCDHAVIVGGSQLSASAQVSFDRLSTGFTNDAAVIVNGKNFDCNFSANSVAVLVMLASGKNAIELLGRVTRFDVRDILYATDVPKNGYEAYDASNVIYANNLESDVLLRNIYINSIRGISALCGIELNSTTVGNINNIHILSIEIPRENTTAIKASKVSRMFINSIGLLNTVDITNSLNVYIELAVNTVDKTVNSNGVFTESIGLMEVPSITNRNRGDIILVATDYGDKVYFCTGDKMIPMDGQMFIPMVDLVPDPQWFNRSKLLIKKGEGVPDRVFTCINDETGHLSMVEITSGYKKSGSTAQRPSLAETDKGFEYLDTTINKLIYWDGTKWIDPAEDSIKWRTIE